MRVSHVRGHQHCAVKRRTRLEHFRYVVKWFMNHFSKNTLSVHAAHVVFFIMVSFFPFVMFFFTLLRYTPLTEESILHLLESIVPDNIRHVLGTWINEAYRQSSGTILSITVITTLWSGSKGFMGITYGLDKIYGVKNRRSWLVNRISSLMYTIAFAAILLISLIVLVYGNQILLAIDSFFSIEAPLFIGIFSLRSILGFTLFFLFFLLLYMFIPDRKPKAKEEVPGALFTSVLWILFSYLFSIYIDYFTNFSSVYGSLTYIVLFMLWMYVCMDILFLGALINRFLADGNVLIQRKPKKANSSKDETARQLRISTPSK